MQATLEESPILDELDLTVDNELPPLDENEEDMKLRDDDKTWLTDEITKIVTVAVRDALDEFRPHGWRRVTNFIREWGIAGAVLGVFVSLFGITLGAAYVAVARVDKQARFETDTTRTLLDTNAHMASIDSKLANLQLSSLSQQPPTQATVARVVELVSAAKATDQKLDLGAVAEAGARFVNAANTSPDAWRAAQELIAYRSFLNSDPQANAKPINNSGPGSQLFALPNYDGTYTFIGPPEPVGVVQLWPLGHVPQLHSDWGASSERLTGGTLHLDGLRMKNIIVVNATVVYEGGEVSLENVVFVNCKFSILPKKQGQMLAQAILSQPAVSYAS